MLKSEAMNPPKDQRVVRRSAPSTSLKETQAAARAADFKAKAADAARLKTEAIATGQKTSAADEPTPVAKETAEAMHRAATQLASGAKDKQQPLQFSMEERALFVDLLPALLPLVMSLKEESMPTPLQLPDAADTAKRWLGESRPCHRATEKKELEESVQRLKNSMASLSPEEAKLLQPRLDAQEAALVKASREPSDLESQLAGVKEAVSKFERAVLERKNRAHMAAAKTAERTRDREAVLRKLGDALEEARKATAILMNKHLELHTARAAKHDKTDQEVRQHLQQKQATLEQAVQLQVVQPSAAEPQPEQQQQQLHLQQL